MCAKLKWVHVATHMRVWLPRVNEHMFILKDLKIKDTNEERQCWVYIVEQDWFLFFSRNLLLVLECFNNTNFSVGFVNTYVRVRNMTANQSYWLKLLSIVNVLQTIFMRAHKHFYSTTITLTVWNLTMLFKDL